MGDFMSVGTILIVLLLLVLVGALPAWRHSSGWGYYPSGGLGLAGFVLVMVARDYRTGLDAVYRALERNPGSGFAIFMAGTALILGGDPEESLALMNGADTDWRIALSRSIPSAIRS